MFVPISQTPADLHETKRLPNRLASLIWLVSRWRPWLCWPIQQLATNVSDSKGNCGLCKWHPIAIPLLLGLVGFVEICRVGCSYMFGFCGWDRPKPTTNHFELKISHLQYGNSQPAAQVWGNIKAWAWISRGPQLLWDHRGRLQLSELWLGALRLWP